MLQVLAIIKRIPFDFLHAVGNSDLFQFFGASKCDTSYLHHIIRYLCGVTSGYQHILGSINDCVTLSAAVIIWIIGRNDNLLQLITTREWRCFYSFDGAWNIHIAQVLAVHKGACIDILQSFIEYHLAEVFAVSKGTSAYLTQRGWTDHFSQCIVVVAHSFIANDLNPLFDG